jgi:hypothetical protein
MLRVRWGGRLPLVVNIGHEHSVDPTSAWLGSPFSYWLKLDVESFFSSFFFKKKKIFTFPGPIGHSVRWSWLSLERRKKLGV